MVEGEWRLEGEWCEVKEGSWLEGGRWRVSGGIVVERGTMEVEWRDRSWKGDGER